MIAGRTCASRSSGRSWPPRPPPGELNAALTALAAAAVAPPHHRGADPLRASRRSSAGTYQAKRERGRSGRRAAPQGPQGSRPAAGPSATCSAQALRAQYARAPELELPAPRRQPARCCVEEDAALGPMPSYSTVRRFMKAARAGPPAAPAPARARRAPRAPRRGSSSARCAATRPSTSTACGISTSTTARARCSRAAGTWVTPHPARRARRSLAPVLPRAVVPRRDGRDARARPGQAIQKRGLPRAAADRQRRADARRPRRTQGLLRLGIVHEHHAAVQPVPERQAGGLLGAGRRAAAGDARGRRRADAAAAERGDAGVGRAGVPPRACTPRPGRRRSQRFLAGPDRRAARVRQSTALRRRLSPRRSAHPAPQRRHRQPRRPCASRSRPATATSTASRCATRAGISAHVTWSTSATGVALRPLYPLDKREERRRPPRRASRSRSTPPRPTPPPEPGSRRCCASSWPSTPPPGLPPAYLPDGPDAR